MDSLHRAARASRHWIYRLPGQDCGASFPSRGRGDGRIQETPGVSVDARWLMGGGTIYRGPFAGKAGGISAEHSRRENYFADAIREPAHGCGFAGRADPFAVSK